MKYCLQPCREKVPTGDPEGLLLTDPWSTRIFHFSSFTNPNRSSAALELPTGPGDVWKQLAGGAEAEDSGTRAGKGQQRRSGATLESREFRNVSLIPARLKTQGCYRWHHRQESKHIQKEPWAVCVCARVCVLNIPTTIFTSRTECFHSTKLPGAGSSSVRVPESSTLLHGFRYIRVSGCVCV